MARFKKDFDWDQIERDNQPEDEIIYVSKSEIKRDGREYRRIASLICDLPLNKIQGFQFDEVLVNAIKHYKDLTNMDAKRRQLNFVTKHLRRYELDVIQPLVIHDSPNQQYTGIDAQLDKRIRVTIERLRQPEFTTKTLELLAQQYLDLDQEYVAQVIAKDLESGESNDGQGSELYNYFFELYRPKAH